MKKVLLFIFIILGIITSGCLGEQKNGNNEPQTTAIPMPTPQYIITGDSSNYRISANEVIIKGSCNNIKILNDGVSKIDISGNNNNVAYPEGARPLIADSGTKNNVGAFEDVLSVPQTGCYGNRN